MFNRSAEDPKHCEPRSGQLATNDALAGKHGEYELVLTNPPFGKKSSVTIVKDSGEMSKESLIKPRRFVGLDEQQVAHSSSTSSPSSSSTAAPRWCGEEWD